MGEWTFESNSCGWKIAYYCTRERDPFIHFLSAIFVPSNPARFYDSIMCRMAAPQIFPQFYHAPQFLPRFSREIPSFSCSCASLFSRLDHVSFIFLVPWLVAASGPKSRQIQTTPSDTNTTSCSRAHASASSEELEQILLNPMAALPQDGSHGWLPNALLAFPLQSPQLVHFHLQWLPKPFKCFALFACFFNKSRTSHSKILKKLFP